MGWTKRQLCDMAFSEIALAGYVFDIGPEEQTSMLLRLDSMMATWEMQGIRIGYNRTVDPQASDPDQDSGLPDQANEAVYLNLAIRSAAGYGKSLAQSTLATAKQGYDALLGKCLANPPQRQLRSHVPAGAGYKRVLAPRPFLNPPVDLLTTGPDGTLDLNGPVPLP